MSDAPKKLVLNFETLKRLDQGEASTVQAGRGTFACPSGACEPSLDLPCIQPFTVPCITTTGIDA